VRALRRKLRLGFFAFFLALCCLAGAAFKARSVYRADHSVQQRAFLDFEVRRGESDASVISRLADLGIGSQPSLVKLWHRWSGNGGCLKAGMHQLSLPISPQEALARLCRSPASASVRVTIKEGENLFELQDRLVLQGWVGPGELMEFPSTDGTGLLSTLPSFAYLPGWDYPNRMEGYLYPSTYDLPIKHSLEALIRRSVRQHVLEWTRVLAEVQPTLGRPLNQHSLMTLASIVQREAKRSDEMAMIAAVYLNRLRVGMKLQADPSMIYGPDIWRLKPTPTLRRWAANHYNTYAHHGLPPGPIGAVSADAMRAVLRPAKTRALFFVARGDGSGRHAFTRTYAEHRARVRELRARRNGKP